MGVGSVQKRLSHTETGTTPRRALVANASSDVHLENTSFLVDEQAATRGKHRTIEPLLATFPVFDNNALQFHGLGSTRVRANVDSNVEPQIGWYNFDVDAIGVRG